MRTQHKPYSYALRLDRGDEKAIAAVVKETGLSINSLLVLSIRKGLPLARESLAKNSSRVTTVNPLPDHVLRRAYLVPDDSESVSAKQLAKFQSQKEPE